LAREVELEYACLAFVVNLAAGVGSLPIKLAEVFDKADSCRAFIAETLEVCISKLHF
jgi:purine nucleoside phosphorylase